MAWGFVQSNTNNAIGASSLTVTYNSNVASGNKLISQIIIAPGVLSTITSVQDAALNSETNCGEASGSSNGNTDGAIYAMDVPAGDAGTRPQIKVTYGQTADMRMIVEEFSGLAVGNTTAAMIDGTATAVEETPVSPQAQPAYTSTAANELLFTFLGDNGNSVSWTLPTGYTADGSNTNGDPNNDLLVAWKNSTNGAETGSWTTGGTPTGSVLIVVAFKLAPSGGPVPQPQPGARSWRQRFKPPQTPFAPLTPPVFASPAPPPQPGPPSWQRRFRPIQTPQWQPATAPTAGVSVPAPVQLPPVPRRSPSRAYWRGGPVLPQVGVPPKQLITIPRRKPARAFIQFTPVMTVNATPPAGVAGTVQPQATVPVPRLRPARALWRGLAVPGQLGQPLRQPPPTVFRRGPARAYWRGGPVSGQAGQAPRQGPYLPPRRKPARAVVQFTPVTTVNQVVAGVAVAAPQQVPPIPRRKPSRAYVQFRAVATVNAPFVSRGQPPQAPDDKGYLVKLYYLTG